MQSLSDAEDKPEGQNPDGYEQHAHQPAMAYSPARQSESDADQDVDQEEDDQKQVQLGMQVFRLLQRQQDFVIPGVSRYQEDGHEDEEHPGTKSIDLDEKSANVQFEFTIIALGFAGIKISGFPLNGCFKLMAGHNLISKSYIPEEHQIET
jgi:hypothetical protein